ncbi:MAG: hypothetical protein RLZZ366_1590 [Pseudomonadota bacterium]|jgi:hypothetical protein
MPIGPPRRVVTGLGVDGRSRIIFDDACADVIWSTRSTPADNGGSEDAGGVPFTFDLPDTGTLFFYTDFAPDGITGTIGMHSSDTLDYAVIVTGAVTLITESGGTLLRAGDVVVDRGVTHAWRNDGPEMCRAIFVFVKAQPIELPE